MCFLGPVYTLHDLKLSFRRYFLRDVGLFIQLRHQIVMNLCKVGWLFLSHQHLSFFFILHQLSLPRVIIWVFHLLEFTIPSIMARFATLKASVILLIFFFVYLLSLFFLCNAPKIWINKNFHKTEKWYINVKTRAFPKGKQYTPV